MPVLFLTIFIDLLGFGIVFPILPNYAREIGIDEALIGFFVFAFAITQFWATPFWGSLSDKIGRRPVILISTIINTIAYFSFGFANSFALIIISRILSGFGSGNISAAQAYIVDITPPEKRAKSMGMIGAAFGLGFIFGPPLGGLIKTYLGMEYVGFLTSALCLLNFVLAYFILPESLQVKDAKRPLQLIPFIPIFKAIAKKGTNIVLGIGFIYTMAFFMFNITANMIWKDKFNFSDLGIAYVFSFIGICTVITQLLLVGWFSRRFKEITLLSVGTLLVGLSLLALCLVPADHFIPYELIILAVLSVANGMVRPTCLSVLSKLTPRNEQGQAMGVFHSVGSVAMGIGPLLAAPLYSWGWQLYIPYTVGGILLIANVLIIFRLKIFLGQKNPSLV